MDKYLNFDDCSINDFSTDPIPNESYFNFSAILNSAMSIERENNGILDTFTWKSFFILPAGIDHIQQSQLKQTLPSDQALWLENNAEFEYYAHNTNPMCLWRNNKTFSTVSAYDFINQRFRYLSRAIGHETRTQLTSQEVIFLDFQTCEFLDHFESNDLCYCEKKSIISWLNRLINIILSKNDIIDLDFGRINNTFEYYRTVNMNEVRCFLNMYENNHNLENKFFFI